ncbi:MAG: hypothetical protein ACJ71N_07000 [Terriglobales bacterium]|jgi:hypothetical protein
MSLSRRRKLYPNILGRVISAVVCLTVCLSGLDAVAQYGRTRKEHKGPRAVAVIEFPQTTKDGKTAVKYAPRLIPAIILNEGRYFDADSYKATPVPWAIQPGTIYEAREAGESKGLFTIQRAAADANKNWIATGMWDSAEAIAARAETKRKAEEAKKAREAALKEQAKDTGPPKLHRGGPDPKQPAPKPVPPPPPATDDDPDRPRMRRGASDESAGSARPQTPEAADPNAPELKRGKPAKDSPLVTAPPPAPKQSPVQLANNKLMAAISDATPDDDRSFLFLWRPEEQKRLTGLMENLAQEELASGTEGDTTREESKRAVKKAPLENVQVRAFDPATNNEAVLILTASSPVQRKDASFNRYVTVVAHVDLDNLPHKLFSSVTDDDHLDTVGILQLVDAVDSDGDGRAEFLFRRIGKYDQRFELYRSYGSQLLKLF